MSHCNIVFDNHKVIRSSKEVGRIENKTTYLVYCNIFIHLHHHCLGGHLVLRFIGRYTDGNVGKWEGRGGGGERREEARVHRQVV